MDKTNSEPAAQCAPSQEYINFTNGLKRLLAVPKAELDRREKEWQQQEHKRGRPKKQPK
jgi:hypothetical protein